MLFRQSFLDGIGRGTITVAFRRWRRPTVRSGGTLLTPVGQLQIASVEQIDAATLTAADARRAGYRSLQALRDELDARPDGDVFRITWRDVLPDPRIALRHKLPRSASDIDTILERLRRLDAHAPAPWTIQVLALIAGHPGVRAGDLCAQVHQEKDVFKTNVRKLKRHGLTESLGTGYRLSPRGRAVLGHHTSRAGAAPRAPRTASASRTKSAQRTKSASRTPSASRTKSNPRTTGRE